MYKLIITKEAIKDIENLAAYMIYSLKHAKAAFDFLKLYRKQAENLTIFPFAYKNTNLTYQGYEIYLKTFSTYNMFFVIDAYECQVTILRVLKDRQNWKSILKNQNKYHF